jgi:hypothetical protein
MSLKMLLKSLQGGFTGAIENVILEVVHGAVEGFDDVNARQDRDIEGVKLMIRELEDRTLDNAEAARVVGERERDVLAAAIEVLKGRLGNVEADPR